jgi:hypothetical protein
MTALSSMVIQCLEAGHFAEKFHCLCDFIVTIYLSVDWLLHMARSLEAQGLILGHGHIIVSLVLILPSVRANGVTVP